MGAPVLGVGTVRLVAIVGPTAVGKTALAVRLAREVDGEIVSADSRQIYRGMAIGTARPTPEEERAARHHLVGIVEPDEGLTLAHYQERARRAVEDIWSRGKVPLLVGGTGLYVRALLEGWTVPRVPPDPALRERLQRIADEEGHEALHARLAEVDPAAARRIDARNVRRVIRALEVYEETGTPISARQRRRPPGYCVLRIGLTMPREALYERVDARIDAMMERGLLDEVRALAERGYGEELPAMSGLGYRQLLQYLRGEISPEDAVALIKRHTRRFVRQQYNWFRLDDPNIHWFDVSRPVWEDVLALVRRFLREPCPPRPE